MAKGNFKDTNLKDLPTLPSGFVYRRTKRGIVVQKSPAPRGKWRTPYELYTQEEFYWATQLAADPEPVSREAAEMFASGSLYIYKDVLIRAMYANLYTLQGPDGAEWQRVRDVAPNPQLSLDLITTTYGSLIWRADIGWVGLDPNNNGFVLTMIDQAPSWQAPIIGAGGLIQAALYDTPGAGSYPLPAGATMIEVHMIGAGGGGGGGARQAVGLTRSGGGGGGGGARNSVKIRTANITSPITFNIGAPGVGGVPRVVNNQEGAGGGNGGFTTVTWNGRTMSAAGGNLGQGGLNGISSGGAANTTGMFLGGAGGNCTPGGNASSPPLPVTLGATGGGAGAGLANPLAARNGAPGSNWFGGTGWPASPAAGGNGTLLTPPGIGVAYGIENIVGGGGGGGYTTAAGVATDGAKGGAYGGGGGGGASSTNGQVSGRGGDGGNGAVLFLAY